MKQLTQNAGRQGKPSKPWIKPCFYGGLGLILLSTVLYLILYTTLDKEFHHNRKFFGEETYKEIFSLEHNKKDFEALLKLAEEAFSFTGSEADAQERFGLLSRYSLTEPDAATEKHTLDYLNSGIGKDSGYLWIAYTQQVYKENGELLRGSGTQDRRVLSRWTVEKRNGVWSVTQIQEGP